MIDQITLKKSSGQDIDLSVIVDQKDSENKKALQKEEAQKWHNSVIAYEHASEEMTRALGSSSAAQMPKIGELIKGRVLDISKDGIVVDIGGWITGIVRGKEIDDESGQFSKLSAGDEVEATVLDLENEHGMLELSFRQAGHRKAWDYLCRVLEKGEVVDAKIINANKGGLMVKVGNVEGFLPVSQLTVEHYPRVEGGDKNRILDSLRNYINQIFRVKIITVREKEEKLIVSEKAAWEREQNELLSKYKIGDVVEGKVTGVVDFGVFVEFGDGLEGLIHISELAWQRIENPSDLIKVGDQIKAKIISVEDNKVSLSRKKLIDDPWRSVSKKYKIGDTVEGKVIKINPYGAFVELDKDIHGLAHVSEISKIEVGVDLKKIFTVGELRKFKILSLEPASHRLGLGIV